MYEIARDVYLLRGKPDYLINAYLIGDVLLDAGTRIATSGILRQLKGHRISAHALTHVHADHQGASKAVCETFGVPLWCPQNEIEAMETGDLGRQIPPNAITRIQRAVWAGPGHPVNKGLREGDVVAGFTILDTPGHSPGHLAYWREVDRLLILGDVARNVDFFTLRESLGEPPAIFTPDIPQNRLSMQKLAALKPRLVCFGHGKPADGAKFVDFAQQIAQA
jgi:glyoxylase-like metal-dependent hydrolase (beta-lactamase superfamily II)